VQAVLAKQRVEITNQSVNVFSREILPDHEHAANVETAQPRLSAELANAQAAKDALAIRNLVISAFVLCLLGVSISTAASTARDTKQTVAVVFHAVKCILLFIEQCFKKSFHDSNPLFGGLSVLTACKHHLMFMVELYICAARM